jgi:hypothetical protein
VPHDAPQFFAPDLRLGKKIEAARSAAEDERFKTGRRSPFWKC